VDYDIAVAITVAIRWLRTSIRRLRECCETTNKEGGVIIVVAGRADGTGGEGFYHNLAHESPTLSVKSKCRLISRRPHWSWRLMPSAEQCRLAPEVKFVIIDELGPIEPGSKTLCANPRTPRAIRRRNAWCHPGPPTHKTRKICTRSHKINVGSFQKGIGVL
jgi:hypothetical protein